MYIGGTALDLEKLRFGYSLDDKGLIFDDYLMDEQDVGAKGPIHYQ